MNTEGYYPADLKVLIERATQEAIIGSINKMPTNRKNNEIFINFINFYFNIIIINDNIINIIYI